MGNCDDCYRECWAFGPAVFRRTGRSIKPTQHADTERLFQEEFIITPVIARCNKFVSCAKIASERWRVTRHASIMIWDVHFGRIPMVTSTFAVLLL